MQTSSIILVTTDDAWAAFYVDGVRHPSYGFGQFDDPSAALRALGLSFQTYFYHGEDGHLPERFDQIDPDELDIEDGDGWDKATPGTAQLIRSSAA